MHLQNTLTLSLYAPAEYTHPLSLCAPAEYTHPLSVCTCRIHSTSLCVHLQNTLTCRIHSPSLCVHLLNMLTLCAVIRNGYFCASTKRFMLHFYDYFIFLPFDQPEEIRILCKILGSRFAIPATGSTDTYMYIHVVPSNILQ